MIESPAVSTRNFSRCFRVERLQKCKEPVSQSFSITATGGDFFLERRFAVR